MTHIVTQEQLWAQFDQLDPQQREEVTALIESFLAEDVSSRRRRDKQNLLTLSTWGEEDLASIQEAQDKINAWQIPTS